MTILIGSLNCFENILKIIAGMSSWIVALQVLTDIKSFSTVFTLIIGILEDWNCGICRSMLLTLSYSLLIFENKSASLSA